MKKDQESNLGSELQKTYPLIKMNSPPNISEFAIYNVLPCEQV